MAVNALSTFPPKFEQPSSSPDQSTIRKLVNIGRSYIKFYKEGVKATWSNYKEARVIKAKLKPGAFALEVLSRADYQLLRRSARDVRRLPAFGLILLVMGEFSPLLLTFTPGLLPATCMLPNQAQTRRKVLNQYVQSLPVKSSMNSLSEAVQSNDRSKLLNFSR